MPRTSRVYALWTAVETALGAATWPGTDPAIVVGEYGDPDAISREAVHIVSVPDLDDQAWAAVGAVSRNENVLLEVRTFAHMPLQTNASCRSRLQELTDTIEGVLWPVGQAPTLGVSGVFAIEISQSIPRVEPHREGWRGTAITFVRASCQLRS